MIEDMFGQRMCSPQYLGLRRVYMKQIDARLSAALHDASLANPNGAAWPSPLAFLVRHLALVSRELQPQSSVTAFVLAHMDEFAAMIRNLHLPLPSTPDCEKPPLGMDGEGEHGGGVFTHWHSKIVHEWMLFGLESWLMVDLSASVENRHDLLSSRTFCDAPVVDLLQPHLPTISSSPLSSSAAFPFSVYAAAAPPMITPNEMTASMLASWKGVRFVWTERLADHLLLDLQTMVVQLYAHVAYSHLHALAGDASSLRRCRPGGGFTAYHQALVEVSDSLRLLFGVDRASQAVFAALAPKDSHAATGFFDIFSLLPPADADPRFLYNVAADFPVFGERLLVLKSLLKPTGLRGLWKDRRDSLQWYTFWYVPR